MRSLAWSLEPGRNLVATARSAAEALGLGLSGKSLPDQVLRYGARAMSELDLEDEVMFFKLTDTEKRNMSRVTILLLQQPTESLY